MADHIQEPPFCAKIELTLNCNLRCPFCAINGLFGPLKIDNHFDFMSVETAERIASEIARLGWRSRIEFTMRGEPSLNPNITDIVQIFRHCLPKTSLMITSNGGGFLPKPGPAARILDLFNAGMNIIALDDYDDAFIVPKIRANLANNPLPADVQVYEYPENRIGNPYTRRHHNDRVLTFLVDLRQTAKSGKGVRDNLSNQGGVAAPPNDRCAGRRCARPFRECVIHHDGRMALCCNDWRGEFKVGSVLDTPLDELWQSAALNAARVKLYHGERDFGPCNGCDSKSFRVGLLPDPAGRVELPRPGPDDEATIGAALSGPPMTRPVLRSWEATK